MKKENLSIDTICIQGGYEAKNGEPRISPIVQSTTFQYTDTETVANLFDLKESGYFYTRIGNPTNSVLEEKITQLEGGVGALSTSSGQSANLLAILTICSEGDHIICTNNVYGGTYNLINSSLKKLGIKSTFLNPKDINTIEEAIQPNTKLIFSETIGNPLLQILDIEKVANIAHKHNIPLIVDNSLATPLLCRPFDFGADIVTHSSTKYLDGHATSVGGLIIDSGNFNWNNEKFSCLTEKDPDYHGLSYTETFGKAAYITKARTSCLRDFGTTMSPFNAFLTNLGIETLSLRMEKHSSNALEIAKYLKNHKDVEWINYPLLESNKDYSLAKKYLKNGGSGVITFAIKGSFEEAKNWINSLNLISLAVHVADVRSHALHPASMTHRQLSEEDLKKTGIDKNVIRLSIGIENVEDIIKDIEQAFEKYKETI